MHRVGARTMYAPGQNRNSYKASRHPFHKNRADAPTPSGQRNPAQKNRLRGITFIRSSQKSGLQMIYQNMNRPLSEKSQTHQKTVVRCNPKLHQQNRPLFVM